MEKKLPSIRSIGFKYGLFTGAAFIVYFLIMQVLGLVQYTELRFLQYIFLPIGIWVGLAEVRKRIHKHRINYLPGLGTGFWITAISSALFALFIWIYSGINPNFIPDVKAGLPFSDYVTPAMLAMGAFGEPFIFGIVFSFVIMQFFKRNADAELEEQEIEEEGKLFHSRTHQQPTGIQTPKTPAQG